MADARKTWTPPAIERVRAIAAENGTKVPEFDGIKNFSGS